MQGIETLVGIVVASYLSILTVVLTYLGLSTLGADERDRGDGTAGRREGQAIEHHPRDQTDPEVGASTPGESTSSAAYPDSR